tara:strand:- start:304 stop:828 length:525 start_codon:yes stop_codon:yes gene_type:complete
VGQEYFINSESLQQKVRQLLPSQGGLGQGQDLSATTQIVPVIDLTETAEGSDVRPDLQTALSFGSTTVTSVSNQTSSIITNTGYWRIFGQNIINFPRASNAEILHIINDGSSDKNIKVFFDYADSSETQSSQEFFDYNIFLKAGESFKVTAPGDAICKVTTRQIATIDGTLIDP